MDFDFAARRGLPHEWRRLPFTEGYALRDTLTMVGILALGALAGGITGGVLYWHTLREESGGSSGTSGGSGLDPFGGEGIPMAPSDFDTLGCDSAQKKRLERAHLAISSKLSAVITDLADRGIRNGMPHRLLDCFDDVDTNCGTYICTEDEGLCEDGLLAHIHRTPEEDRTFFCMNEISESSDDCKLQELMAATSIPTNGLGAFGPTDTYTPNAQNNEELGELRESIRNLC